MSWSWLQQYLMKQDHTIYEFHQQIRIIPVVLATPCDYFFSKLWQLFPNVPLQMVRLEVHYRYQLLVTIQVRLGLLVGQLHLTISLIGYYSPPIFLSASNHAMKVWNQVRESTWILLYIDKPDSSCFPLSFHYSHAFAQPPLHYQLPFRQLEGVL